MIERIEFRRFKALKDTVLPLGPFTLIVGANNSGKSSALQALQLASLAIIEGSTRPDPSIFTAGLEINDSMQVEVDVHWAGKSGPVMAAFRWGRNQHFGFSFGRGTGESQNELRNALRTFRVFSFNPGAIANAVQIQPSVELAPDGSNLAAVMDDLRDRAPERFSAMNAELAEWLPEFDQVLFMTPHGGAKQFMLRTRIGHYAIPATSLSQGTLLCLALLTLSYLPIPPRIIGIEEPERGIHPRLMSNIRDAIYRLAYPKPQDNREAVQVIATTHSPYFLDLFRDHIDEVIVSHKTGLVATFQRLADRRDLSLILGDSPLGEAWYSGVLGGVPSGP